MQIFKQRWALEACDAHLSLPLRQAMVSQAPTQSSTLGRVPEMRTIALNEVMYERLRYTTHPNLHTRMLIPERTP